MDVVSIGSGISGTSPAQTLLAKGPELKVVLIDARSLCSGANGRNGGHIKTMIYALWEERKRAYGAEEAIRISEFEFSHIAAITKVIRENGIDCDLVTTIGIDAYYDPVAFDRDIAALNDLQAYAPHLAAQYTIHTDKEWLQKVARLSYRCVGAIAAPAASLWPYKMVTSLLSKMIKSSNLNVQTHTGVEAIDDHDEYDFAVVRTDRGSIRAKNVVHATNGWLGYLLPELRPFISPVRGNVVRYGPVGENTLDSDRNDGASPLRFDSRFSVWLRYAKKDYDYLIQRAQGDIVVGRANTGRKATGDDSQTDMLALAHLRGFPTEVAASPAVNSAAYITHTWSGILGLTQDTMPFAGRIPFSGRYHQWVCGGYLGIGMVKAFRTAQMVALQILGEQIDDEYPKSML